MQVHEAKISTKMSNDGREQFATELINQSGDRSANFEEAILSTGFGQYNIKLLLVCGTIVTSVALQFGLSAYIIPSAQCELDLSSSEMGLLNAGFLIGCAIGGVISGAIADAIGRKTILIWSVFIDGCVSIFSALSQNFPVLFLFRCISGLIVGGPAGIPFTYLGEFHTGKSKTKVLCYLGFFFTISWILLPVLAWIIIPLEFKFVVFGLVFNSWRLFLGIPGFLSFFGAFLLSKYPETPKFLLSQGEKAKVLQIMREMFITNTKLNASDYPIKMLISDCSTTDDKRVNSLSATMNGIWIKFCCLSSPPLLKYIILTSFILFANMAGYFGLGLWLPELLNRFEFHYKLHPNVTTTVCELAYLRKESKNEPLMDSKALEHLDTGKNLTLQMMSILSNTMTVKPSIDNTPIVCNSSIDGQVFVNTIIIGCCCLLGNLVTVQLVNLWERRIMPIITMVIPGVCGCAIYLLRTSMQNLIVTCIFTAFMSMSNVLIYSLIVEMFPTNVNTVAVGIISVAGRLGAVLSNVVFGLLLDISCEVPIFLMGGIIILGGFLGFLLPAKPISFPRPIGDDQ